MFTSSQEGTNIVKHKKPLFYIILSAILIVAIIPYAAYSLLNTYSGSPTPAADVIDHKEQQYLSTALKISTESILQAQLLNARNLAESISNQENKPESEINYSNSAVRNNFHIMALAVISQSGAILGGSPPAQGLLPNLKTATWYQKDKECFTAFKHADQIIIALTVPIPTSKNLLLTLLNPEIFTPLKVYNKTAGNLELEIITRTGLIVFSTVEGQAGTSVDNQPLRLALDTGKTGYIQAPGSDTPANISRYTAPLNLPTYQTNLNILTSSTATPATGTILQDNLKYILPTALLLLASILAAAALYLYITAPINQIVRMITYVHSGIFNYEMNLNRSGELGMLLKSFNEMMNNLEKRFLYQKRMRQEILLRNRYEEKLKLSRAEAVSLSKAKDEFLTNISHEIRTPLNAIIGFSEKLLLENKDKAFTKSIKTILSESDHLLLLLNDLLDNAKIEADKLDLEYIPFDLYKCIQDTTESFKESALKKNLTFSLEISEDTPRYIIFDPLRFKQVLVNLLSNAIKFTEEGSIIVRTSVIKVTPKLVDVSFYVTDTGIGIPKHKQKSIFDEFSQADGSTTRKYGGTGLGTTISKKLVTLMGGEMCLESEPGKGSTFWFTLSLNTNISESDLIKISHENSSTPRDNANKFNGTILVAEDYEVNQDLIRSQLEYLGLNVLIADNGRIAVDDCKRVFFDLIFMDLQMPEMGGIEAARRIRIDYPHYEKVPIIALTANADKDIRNICKAVGMNGILNKPTHIDELAASLLKWLPRSCHISPITIPEETIEKFQNNTFTCKASSSSSSSTPAEPAEPEITQDASAESAPHTPPIDFSAAHKTLR